MIIAPAAGRQRAQAKEQRARSRVDNRGRIIEGFGHRNPIAFVHAQGSRIGQYSWSTFSIGETVVTNKKEVGGRHTLEWQLPTKRKILRSRKYSSAPDPSERLGRVRRRHPDVAAGVDLPGSPQYYGFVRLTKRALLGRIHFGVSAVQNEESSIVSARSTTGAASQETLPNASTVVVMSAARHITP